MRATELIAKKRNGASLTAAEIQWLLEEYTTGTIPDYQMSAFLMAIFFQGMDASELSHWTHCMLHSGHVMDLSHLNTIKVDKHSTGGVGDKISLPLAPLVASCGLTVPMISGRGLGHTGGTLDKLESIPGFRTNLSVALFQAQLDKLGVALIGQTAEICPTDKKLYALRDVTSTVESIPLIASSIMSKKLAEGIDGLVLDVKVGNGAFMKTHERAQQLARTMVDIGEKMGTDVIAILTRMDAPLGRMVGNALEVMESIDVLRGVGPEDVRSLTLTLAESMLTLGGLDPSLAKKNLDNGQALDRFRAIVAAQGGDVRAIDDPSRLPKAASRSPVIAEKSGYIDEVNGVAVGLAAMHLGAGRAQKTDLIDPGVGVEMAMTVGDPVKEGEPLAWLHHNGRGVAEASDKMSRAIHIGAAPPPVGPLVLEMIKTPHNVGNPA